LEKKFNAYVEQVKNSQHFNQSPVGDNVPPLTTTNTTVQPTDERERLIFDEEASDSGVSDPFSSHETGL